MSDGENKGSWCSLNTLCIVSLEEGTQGEFLLNVENIFMLSKKDSYIIATGKNAIYRIGQTRLTSKNE